MLEEIYQLLKSKLINEYNLNIGLMLSDKVILVIPGNVIDTNCSLLYDLVNNVITSLNIMKKDVCNYIACKSCEEVTNVNVEWYNTDQCF